jgi:hypothetical protein
VIFRGVAAQLIIARSLVSFDKTRKKTCFKGKNALLTLFVYVLHPWLKKAVIEWLVKILLLEKRPIG